MWGFLPFILASVSNHDIEPGNAGLASLKKWSLVAEFFLPVMHANADTARLQRQIEDLSAKLERTQMRVVSEQSNPRKGYTSARARKLKHQLGLVQRLLNRAEAEQ